MKRTEILKIIREKTGSSAVIRKMRKYLAKKVNIRLQTYKYGASLFT